MEIVKFVINDCLNLVIAEETAMMTAKADKMCSICGKGFSLTGNLNVHIAAMHSVLSVPVRCTKKFCTNEFDTMYAMVAHRSQCAFTCGVCGKVIRKAYRVKGHMRKCDGKE